MGRDVQIHNEYVWRRQIDSLLSYWDSFSAWLNANPTYAYVIIGLLALVVLVFLVLIVRELRRPAKTSNVIFKDLTPGDLEDCLIEDEELGTVRACINFGDYVPSVNVGDTREPVRKWNYYSDMVYYLKCRKKYDYNTVTDDTKAFSIAAFIDGYLTPIEPPLELGEMPDSLWRALHRAYDFIPIEFEVPPPEWLMGMMKYAVIALVVGAFIFVVAKGKG